MKKIRILISVVTLLWSSAIMADSPLTSTHFADVYKSKKIVKRAIGADGKITPVLMDYLANEENPVDVKIAIVNALSYGKDNYKLFWGYLKNKYSAVPESALLANLDASTLISLAYISKHPKNYPL